MKTKLLAFLIIISIICIGCGNKNVETIDNTMPTSIKSFEELGFKIYDASNESLGVKLFPGANIHFSTIIMNENMSVIGFTDNYEMMYCRDLKNDNWSMITAYNPNYKDNTYKTFQDGSQFPAVALKNAYIIAQIMSKSPINSMKYVLPQKLADTISDENIEITLNLLGNSSENGDFPKDISEGMWMITFSGKGTNNSLTIVPGKANPQINAGTLDIMFESSVIETYPELRELYANVFNEMDKEGSSFNSDYMKAELGDNTIKAIQAVLPYLSK
ncbi:hypothetical protein [Butyrivibrio sp.]|uniref:hypothetical protein n=1 Tax=Butyrivibrio sp. TaxID=28121 RepID=UPI0025C58C41|nr:hypothetical protein [Butyrivibrio sp.]MBE5838052.1 hypothetical protein [Butyrivibrio sp.]